VKLRFQEKMSPFLGKACAVFGKNFFFSGPSSSVLVKNWFFGLAWDKAQVSLL